MNKVYFYKGDIKKFKNLTIRLQGVTFIYYSQSSCAFNLDKKLSRKIKILKLSNKKPKNIFKLLKIIKECKTFNSVKDFENFKNAVTVSTPMKWRTKNDKYDSMPSYPKKDNQKLYIDNSSDDEYNNMSKNELIKRANSIKGSKIRRPRKSANKKKWINFIKRFKNNNDIYYQ